ncbi:4'-phosphopantetheinyl transferase family protein [Dyella acidisoli]|uniref:4'-phosphopantetheinyl transferase n=1 Tax=Dyella acidisoli TaxID=1867834 RepID=A0ABQ5XJ12_9GAMM|nr:4'-phosphopantetheinyl transferase superfamily protein [Dyella acidisoli]GLQ91332.1 4'-phosphopantetheinyl transferase [Dyella acidisoli]
MRTTQGQDVAGIAAGLDNHQIHVWRLRYDRAQRREPLCALLSIYLGVPAASISLEDGEHGRPELAEPLHQILQFNWSHSGDAALIAVARDVAPGIDIERLRPRAHAMQLAERFFHPEETAALAALNAAEQEPAFLQLWTGKEAVLKAMGRGIAFGLDRLRLTVMPMQPSVLWVDGDDPAQWQLHTLPAGADHVASVAWRGPDRVIANWTLADSA